MSITDASHAEHLKKTQLTQITERNAMTTFKFNDRATYLTWAKEWKSGYSEHSALIRQLKAAFRQAQREGDIRKANGLGSSVLTASRQATEMIEVRHASKIEAQRQYLASALMHEDRRPRAALTVAV